MTYYENQCCDCAAPGYPCMGELCGLRHVKVYVCDECKEEVGYGDLFYYEGKELCADCIIRDLKRVEQIRSFNFIEEKEKIL